MWNEVLLFTAAGPTASTDPSFATFPTEILCWQDVLREQGLVDHVRAADGVDRVGGASQCDEQRECRADVVDYDSAG